MKPGRIYLRNLAVAPRDSLSRYLEGGFAKSDRDVESAMEQRLREIFTFPPAEPGKARPTDRHIDISIRRWSTGCVAFFGLPMIWRPKICLEARLYSPLDEKMRATVSATDSMRWSEIGREFLSSGRLSYFPTAFAARSAEEKMLVLLNRASIALLERLTQLERKRFGA